MRNVLITAVAGIVLAFAAAKHAGNQARLDGCQVMLNKVANPALSPQCSLQDGKLVVRFTNPVTQQEVTDKLE